MSLGLTESVEAVREGVLIDFLNRSETGGSEALLIYVLPVTGSAGMGGASNGFLDNWYRLGCELLVSYGLVPELNMSITFWGRGSVIRGTAVRGEVGAIWDGNIVPKLIGIKRGWGWWSGIPVTPRIVTGGCDGSGVVAHVKSPRTRGKLGIH